MSTATPAGSGFSAGPASPQGRAGSGPTLTGADRSGSALAVEQNGINVIDESERKGAPRDLFWPWAAANISVLGVSYGSFILGFGVSFGQATVAAVVGIVFSFLLVGLVSRAGTRGSAPTMVISRAAFGVRGNGLPSLVSWILLVGWETALTALATLATATVFERLGWASGNATMVLAFIVIAAVVVGAGILGFDAIMKLQTYLTVVLAVVTVGYIALTFDEISWTAATDLPAGSTQAFVGALVLAMTGFGLGWVNAGADYSRYLPRSASPRGIVGWTTFGASIAPIVLVVYGILLVASNPDLSGEISANPVGALAQLLPTWFLVPFVVVAVGGLIGGAVLDIYSSGLTLLTLGLRVPRWTAAAIDGVLMMAGTVYVVWVADDFLTPFMGFLITLGVPMAAWCGIFLGDLLSRRRPYAEADLYDDRGRYGAVNWLAVITFVVATVIGWGLVFVYYTETFQFGGFLLEPLGLGPRVDGPWTYANIGVLVALALGFLSAYVLGRSRVSRQELVSSQR